MTRQQQLRRSRKSIAGAMVLTMLQFIVMTPWRCLPASGFEHSDDDPPQFNVLFIAVDDLACTLGCYGDPVAITPNIDALAASGVRFSHAYNQLPLCNPTRASVMTGLRPDHIKVYDLDRHFRDEVPDVITLPQAFENAGYRTARSGKIFHYNVPAGIGTDGLDDLPSWQERMNPVGRDRAEESLIINAEPHRPISAALSWLAADGTDEEQTDGMVASEAIDWLNAHHHEQFFLAVGFFRPHTPYVAPKKYFELHPREAMRLPYAPDDDRQDIPPAAFAHNCFVPNYGLPEEVLLEAKRAYYASVSFVDAQIGRLLDSLESLGCAENTIVVLWSDHGYHLGEHQGVWQKRTLFEASARAPLIIRTPHASGNGQTCSRVVEFVDIYPTLLDAANVAHPQGQRLDGQSLVPLLNQPDETWAEYAVTQVLRPADSRLPRPVMGRSIRTARYRYTEWAEGDAGAELYDYHSDPGEFQNLALKPNKADAELIKVLRRELSKRASGKVPESPFNPARL